MPIHVTAVDCIQRNTPSCDRNLAEAACRVLNSSNMQSVPQICMDLREVSLIYYFLRARSPYSLIPPSSTYPCFRNVGRRVNSDNEKCAATFSTVIALY